MDHRKARYIRECPPSPPAGREVESPADCSFSQSAGYEDEDIGNAQFDAGEYIDVLTRCGYRLVVQRGHYWEYLPDRALTKEEDDAVTAVRWKYCRASKALQLLKDECERRGLIA